MKPPQTGWTTPAEIVRVIDGDTLVVRVSRELHVRLLDCWAPESRTTDLEEKHRGLKSKEFLQKLIDDAGVQDARLFVPTNGEQDLSSVLTLGRVLGKVWLANGTDLSETMVEAGKATAAKQVNADDR